MGPVIQIFFEMYSRYISQTYMYVLWMFKLYDDVIEPRCMFLLVISVLYSLCDDVYFTVVLFTLDVVFTVCIEYDATTIVLVIITLAMPFTGRGASQWHSLSCG